MLNEVLKLVRLYHRMDQKSTAEKLGISPPYLSEIEAGKKPPSLKLLEKYQEVFSLPASSLLLITESLQEGSKKSISGKALKILKWAAS